MVSVRKRVRNSEIVNRNPALLNTLRKVWNGIDALHVRQDRSYLHGLLFDLKGGLYNTEGMNFRIAAAQFPRSYRSRLYFDIYEAPERALAHKWIHPDSSVLELGGCVGVVSCVVNKLLDQPKNHVVVEANPSLIDILRGNRDANGCSFQIENRIVSRGPDAEFYIGNIMTANSKDSGVGTPIRVKADTLEALEDRHAVKFDTVILDIEGGEFDFFTENAARLADMRLIILELHRGILTAEQVEQCYDILKRAGLKQVDVREQTEVWARPDLKPRSLAG